LFSLSKTQSWPLFAGVGGHLGIFFDRLPAPALCAEAGFIGFPDFSPAFPDFSPACS